MLIKHAFDTFQIFLFICVITITLAGFGRLIASWLKINFLFGSMLFRVWLGISAVITLGEFINFFSPLNWVVVSCLIFIGFLLEVINSQFLQRLKLTIQVLKEKKYKNLFVITAIIISVFIWASTVMTGPTNYDSGLYHFSSIRWLNEYSTVPGLVNLHNRLGYNQSYFIFVALSNYFPVWERGYAVSGLYLYILTALTVIQIVKSVTHSPKFLILCMLVLVGGIITKASSPAPDLAIQLFQVAIFFITLYILKENLVTKVQENALLSTLIIMSTTAITMKLSIVVYVVAFLAILYKPIFLLIINQRKLTIKLVVISLVIIGVHALRGYVLSGVPFYPSTFAGLWQLSWAPTMSQVLAEANSIYSWAKLPGGDPAIVLDSWEWLRPWVNALPTRFLVLIGGFASLTILSMLISFKLNSAVELRKLNKLYLPLVLAIIFWFFSAPDIRFLGVIPELLLTLSAWLLWEKIFTHRQRIWTSYRYLILLPTILICIICTLQILKIGTGLNLAKTLYLDYLLFGLSQIGIDRNFFILIFSLLLFYFVNKSLKKINSNISINILKVISSVILLYAYINYIVHYSGFNNANLSGWVEIPQEPYESKLTDKELSINTPLKGELCWNAPLPCSAHFRNDLRTIPIGFNSFGYTNK